MGIRKSMFTVVLFATMIPASAQGLHYRTPGGK